VADRPNLGIVTLRIQAEGDRVVGITPAGEKLTLDPSVQFQSPKGIAVLKKALGGSAYKSAEQLSAPVERWRKFADDVKSKPYTRDLGTQIDEAMKRLEELTDPARQVPAPGRGPASVAETPKVDSVAVKSAIEQLSNYVQTAYGLALKNNDADATAQFASVHLSLREERKSYFGSREADNYKLASYQTIFDSGFAACKVVVNPNDTKPIFASGCLIGPNLVLTCAHDVKDGEEWKVVFSDKDNKEVSKRQATLLFVGKPRNDHEGPLDYALLKVDPDPNDPVTRIPFKLSKKRISLDTPIYCIGHSGGQDLQVHDYARVVLPHELAEKDRENFMIRLQADLLRENRLNGTNTSTDATAKIEFDRRYKKSVPGSTTYFYHSQFHNRQIPVFGADTDTFQGDSGGPVILRKDGTLAGILIEGMEDNSFFATATILAHERCLTVKSVIDQLAPKPGSPPLLPGWPDEFGVKFE
jgi:V8-like Glu-specific endopeptidase